MAGPIAVRLGRWTRAVAACAALAAFHGTARAQNDTIETQDGQSQTGKILTEDYSGLELQVKPGSKKKIEWKDVAGIQYGGAPELADLAAKFATIPAADALATLTKLKGDAKLRPVVKQQVLFRLASLAVREGDLDGSVAAWQELVTSFPNGRYLDQAARGVVDANLARANPGEAAKALDAVAAAAKAGNPGPRFDAMVSVLKARLLEAQGNAAGAKAAYEAAEGAGALSQEQAAFAGLGIGRCLKAAGDLSGAESRFRKLVESADSPRLVKAGAWNGLADLLLDSGRKKRDTEQLRLALYEYLRSVSVYLPLDGEPTTEQQAGLAGAALACESISQVDTNKDVKTAYTQKALELRERLKKLNPAAAGK